MIKLERLDVYGWEAAVRGLRNPMNSWAKSDSVYEKVNDSLFFDLGDKDLDLCLRMNAHPEESKYRRMIIVSLDVTAPLYWWKEYDTYKVGTVANSCSTMHKIHSKSLDISDFSTEHLSDVSKMNLETTIELMNSYRDLYLEQKDKNYWWQIIQLLPTSYNQKRTIQLNYEVLAQIYRQRKNHKLDEWHDFCHMIEKLPYSVLIIGGDTN